MRKPYPDYYPEESKPMLEPQYNYYATPVFSGAERIGTLAVRAERDGFSYMLLDLADLIIERLTVDVWWHDKDIMVPCERKDAIAVDVFFSLLTNGLKEMSVEEAGKLDWSKATYRTHLFAHR